MALAGADASACHPGDTVDVCMEEAVKAYLTGVPQRYAGDGQLYTASDFIGYYKQNWMSFWNEGPDEKKLARDKHAYTAAEFLDFYGRTKWASMWQTAQNATQRRIASDGNIYTIDQFHSYYTSEWQKKWNEAGEVSCVECMPYLVADEATQPPSSLDGLNTSGDVPITATVLM